MVCRWGRRGCFERGSATRGWHSHHPRGRGGAPHLTADHPPLGGSRPTARHGLAWRALRLRARGGRGARPPTGCAALRLTTRDGSSTCGDVLLPSADHLIGDQHDVAAPESSVAAQRDDARYAALVGPPVDSLRRHMQNPSYLARRQVVLLGRHLSHLVSHSPPAPIATDRPDNYVTTPVLASFVRLDESAHGSEHLPSL